jgi:hypothetical protein
VASDNSLTGAAAMTRARPLTRTIEGRSYDAIAEITALETDVARRCRGVGDLEARAGHAEPIC